MWIVRLALRRPYTVAVMALLILLLGALSIRSMLIDIFPVIDIPVVIVVWNYNGLSANEMEKKVTFLSERAYSSSVNGIDKIESQSIPGISMLKIYFEPGSDIGAAIAQMSAVSNTALRSMPPGMTPPVILQYNASNVPVAQITLSSKNLSEDKIFDYGLNFIRLRLFTIPGLATPAPFGGKNRQIIVDIDPQALAAKGLSTVDVLNALQASNLIIPAGTARMGQTEYNVQLNSSPESVKQFETIPIKVSNGQVVLIGDVAKVSDSYGIQNNIVRVNQARASYLTILKKANASTLVVVDAAKSMIPSIKEVAPEGLDMQVDFDQSVFVKNSISNVLHEAITASILVSFMILFFLGSWRSVIIVCTSIPLSIFISIIGLKLTGNTLNIMTLGGLSLAVGMLVDDATVEIENIHRNRHLGKPLTVAILDGAHEIATPALVATMAICIVFFPVVLLTGPAQFLFTPMALSVVIAMMASYLLSRTLVPVLARMLMASEHLDEHGHAMAGPGFLSRMGYKFNVWRDKAFDRFTEAYGSVLKVLLAHRVTSISLATLAFIITMFLIRVIGTDFFPATDSGMMKLHFRAPSGTRIEETEKLVDAAETRIKHIVPPSDLNTINDMIGVPVSYNLAFVNTDNASGMDAEILISLKEGHKPTVGYMKKIRKELNDHFPGCTVYFQSPDIVSQVLNFGLSAPIDIQIQYGDYNKSYDYALKIRDQIKVIPGVEDVAIKQVLDYPTLNVDVDRVRAAQLGLTQRDIANDVLVSLSSSSQISPSYYINPTNSVNYPVNVQVPYQIMNSTKDLMSIPITPTASQFVTNPTAGPADVPISQIQTLGNIAKLTTGTQFNQFNHYTVQRVMNISANVESRDLGSVASAIQQRIDSLGKLPAGMRIDLRGQSEVMNSSFQTLGLGLLLAIALVYLLMVVLFQSWMDPFIIMLALPGAFMGILWMLVLTGTTLNVESLMGSIVAVGIAVSNSILLVSFANDIRGIKGLNAIEGALLAGKTRLRPVLMTAIAMVLGMIPMAIGAGEGGEQNAPLGRAVIGGLLIATVFTLFVVPIFYSVLRKGLPSSVGQDEKFEAEAQGAMAS
ncbi:MAG: acriflavin resistance protein [Bacteroidetes bacterium]|nr:acriflavin resistance protein [Bacteroidota bacterium]